jgi:hypothetical protein
MKCKTLSRRCRPASYHAQLAITQALTATPTLPTPNFAAAASAPDRNDKTVCGHRHSCLAREYRSEQDGIAMLHNELDNIIHTEVSSQAAYR